MKKSKFYLLSGILGLAITTLLVSNIASAAQGNGNADSTGPKFNNGRSEEMQIQRDAMQEAIASGDYDAWKEIVDSRPRISDYINESNFDQFSEMHNLMQAGNIEEAQAIRDELGLPEMGMGFGGKGHGMGRSSGQGNCPFADDQE